MKHIEPPFDTVSHKWLPTRDSTEEEEGKVDCTLSPGVQVYSHRSHLRHLLIREHDIVTAPLHLYVNSDWMLDNRVDTRYC